MSRKPRAAVTTVLALLLAAAAAWTAHAADNPAPNMFGLDEPEELVSVKGLCCPGLNCSISAELDVGLLSMVRPVLEQVLQVSTQIPGPAEGLGKAAKRLSPGAVRALTELFDDIKAVAFVVQTPRDGEISIAKISTFYLQKARSVGWKPFMQIKQGDGTITLFQLPAKTPGGAAAEPPQGFVGVMISSREVIAAGMLGQLDTSKLIPLLMQAGLGAEKADVEEDAP